MKPFHHLFLGFLFSLILYFFGLSLIGSLVVFICSFFIIDLDHVFLFVLEKKSINPFYFWRYAKSYSRKWKNLTSEQKENYQYPVLIFHSIEFLLLLSIFSLFFNLVSFILIGFLFHLLLDLIDYSLRKEPLYTKFCLLLVLKRNKNKKKLRI